MSDSTRLAAGKAVGVGFLDFSLNDSLIRIPQDDPRSPGQPPLRLDFGGGIVGTWDAQQRVYRLSIGGIAGGFGVCRADISYGDFAGSGATSAQISLSPVLPATGWIVAFHVHLPTVFLGGPIASTVLTLGVPGDTDHIGAGSLSANVVNRPVNMGRSDGWQYHAEVDTILNATIIVVGGVLGDLTQGETNIEILYTTAPLGWSP